MLFHHRHEDGTYIVSKTPFEDDYIHISNPNDILSWLEKGYRLRMSNPSKGIIATSLIRPEAIFRPAKYNLRFDFSCSGFGILVPESSTNQEPTPVARSYSFPEILA